MKIYTTVELARSIEYVVVGRLTTIYKGCNSGVATVFDLHQEVKGFSCGGQVTAGFFNKVLSDLRKVGVIQTRSGGREVFLSDSMKEQINKEVAAIREAEAIKAAAKSNAEGGK